MPDMRMNKDFRNQEGRKKVKELKSERSGRREKESFKEVRVLDKQKSLRKQRDKGNNEQKPLDCDVSSRRADTLILWVSRTPTQIYMHLHTHTDCLTHPLLYTHTHTHSTLHTTLSTLPHTLKHIKSNREREREEKDLCVRLRYDVV